MLCQYPEEAYALPLVQMQKSWEIKAFKNERVRAYTFTAERKSNAINISRSLAMAYVMDQISYDIVEDIIVRGDRLRDIPSEMSRMPPRSPGCCLFDKGKYCAL